ncbi:hypothetical protein L211DRAFT_642454 [Terfezia boudieri ATCC MYA-4762]|uniref:Uncharacterized protein n=1 Tax=Terfezia boudieri ATCC MYA-4762 TaxID=1051890 RepID=A0A3N4L8I8_9PEZI|nr:hypothetical protein L211DRAFT_642454 [Terfezia boudieri ATCC MYA-4762]
MLAIRTAKHLLPLSGASFGQAQHAFSQCISLKPGGSDWSRNRNQLGVPQARSGFKQQGYATVAPIFITTFDIAAALQNQRLQEHVKLTQEQLQQFTNTLEQKIAKVQQELDNHKEEFDKHKQEFEKYKQLVDTHNQKLNELQKCMKVVYVTSILPLHKAVLLEQVAKELGIYRHKALDLENNKLVKLPLILQSNSEKWKDVGLSSEGDMSWISQEWENVMTARNTVAHTVTALSTREAFQYLEGEERRVYGLLFKKFFGWDMVESMSDEQKEQKLNNYPEEHPYLPEF